MKTEGKNFIEHGTLMHTNRAGNVRSSPVEVKMSVERKRTRRMTLSVKCGRDFKQNLIFFLNQEDRSYMKHNIYCNKYIVRDASLAS